MSKYIDKRYFYIGRMLMYPLIGIKDEFECNCYLWWKDTKEKYYDWSIENFQVIILFLETENERFKGYEKDVLLKSERLVACYTTEDGMVYVFDLLEKWADDVLHMLKGKYSLFSKEAKRLIRRFYNDFWSQNKPMTPTDDRTKHLLHMAFEPHLYFDVVGEDMDIDPNELKKVGELLNKIDEEKETLCKDIIEDCNCIIYEPKLLDNL